MLHPGLPQLDAKLSNTYRLKHSLSVCLPATWSWELSNRPQA